jgi:hypothetical protein
MLRAVLLCALVLAVPPVPANALTAEQAAQAERVLQIKRLQQRLLMNRYEQEGERGPRADGEREAFEHRRRAEEPTVVRRGISQRPSPEAPGERAAFSRQGRSAGPLTAKSTLSYATNKPVNDPNLDDPTRGDAQSEPSIAVWGNYVLAGWNDGRGSTFQGGASLPNLLNYGYSTDGGQMFTTGPPSGPTALPVTLLGGVWTSDPVITVNEKTGDFYFCGLFDPPNDGTGPDEGGVAVARATFSGGSIVWNRPVVVRSLPLSPVTTLPDIDKPWIFADSTTGNLYLSYTRYTTTVDSILFSRSTDQGATWSPSITLSSAAAAGWVQGSRPVAGPDCEL